MTSTTENEQPLQTVELESVKHEILLGGEEDQSDPELIKQAEELTEKLLQVDPEDNASRLQAKSAVESMSSRLQLEAVKRSEMLKQPMKQLSRRSEDGGPVANSLIDLKMKVEELDPAQIDLDAGWFSRMLGHLPFVGTSLKRYFSRFENASTMIEAIVNSLKEGREQLKKDNITLEQDQLAMRELTKKLQRSIKLGELIDKNLSEMLETKIPADDLRYRFVQEELLFPLRQRIQDLQQQLAVNQQGVLTTEIIMRNNKELIRGVNRAINVTVNALQVGVTLALALANQKIVLDKIEAVNKTTDALIASNAQRLRQQGVEIHKQAASSQINIDTLRQAFVDINAALEEMSNYRSQALPQMEQNINELDELAQKTEASIRTLETSKKLGSGLVIEVD